MNFDKLLEYLGLEKQEFYFQFNSHPHFPSALAFSDTLNFMDVNNNAYELEKHFWNELPTEFIALIDNSFSLVNKKNDHYIIYSDKVRKISSNELLENSNDLVLIFDKIENFKNSTTTISNVFIYGICSLIIIYSILFFKWYAAAYNIFSVLGFFISLEIFKEKVGHDSKIVKNICGVSNDKNGDKIKGCSKIFSSDKINFLGLKLSDLCLAYFFTITTIGLLFPSSQFALKFLSVVASFFILYSLYIQGLVQKSYCRICFIIILILSVQLSISVFFLSWNMNINLLFFNFFILLSSFLAVNFVSKLVDKNKNLTISNTKNLKFKRNYEIFRRELITNEHIVFTNRSTFFLGNKNAKLHISLVTSPYCSFCKDAHKIIETLSSKYPEEISFQIRFNYLKEDNDKKYEKILLNLADIYYKQPKEIFLEAIRNIYEYKNEDKAVDLNQQIDDNKILQTTNEMSIENENSGLNFTPVLIINGFPFPKKYEREDIYYFIDDLLLDEEILMKNGHDDN